MQGSHAGAGGALGTPLGGLDHAGPAPCRSHDAAAGPKYFGYGAHDATRSFGEGHPPTQRRASGCASTHPTAPQSASTAVPRTASQQQSHAGGRPPTGHGSPGSGPPGSQGRTHPPVSALPPSPLTLHSGAIEGFLTGQQPWVVEDMRPLLYTAMERGEDYSALMETFASDFQNPRLAVVLNSYRLACLHTRHAVAGDRDQLVTVLEHWFQQVERLHPGYTGHRLVHDDVPAVPAPPQLRRTLNHMPPELFASAPMPSRGRGKGARPLRGPSPLGVGATPTPAGVPPMPGSRAGAGSMLGTPAGGLDYRGPAPYTAPTAPGGPGGPPSGRGRGSRQRDLEEDDEVLEQRREATASAAEREAELRVAADTEARVQAAVAKAREEAMLAMAASPKSTSGPADLSNLRAPLFFNLKLAGGRVSNAPEPEEPEPWSERRERRPQSKAALRGGAPCDAERLRQRVNYPQGEFGRYLPTGRKALLYDLVQLWLYYCAQDISPEHAADQVARMLLDALHLCDQHGSDRRLQDLDATEHAGERGVVEIVHSIDRFLLPADESEIDAVYDKHVWEEDATLESFAAADMLQARRHLAAASVEREFRKKLRGQIADRLRQAELADDSTSINKLRELQKDFVEGFDSSTKAQGLVDATRKNRTACTFRPRDIRPLSRKRPADVRQVDRDSELEKLKHEMEQLKLQKEATGQTPPPAAPGPPLQFGRAYSFTTKEGKVEQHWPALDVGNAQFVEAFEAACVKAGLDDVPGLEPSVIRNQDPASEGKFEVCPLCRLARVLLKLKPMDRCWPTKAAFEKERKEQVPPGSTVLAKDGSEVIGHFKQRCRLFDQVMLTVPAFMRLHHAVISDEEFSKRLRDAPGPRASRGGKGKGKGGK